MKYKGALIDLDGVIYNDSRVIDGAVEAVIWLENNNIPFRFITNTTMKSRETLCRKLTDFGIKTTVDKIFSAAYAAALYVRNERGAKCYPLLAQNALRDFDGLISDDEDVEYVVAGDMGEDFTYHLLNEAFRRLQSGAKLIAVQKNRFWLSDDGYKLDAGPFVALLEYAADKEAILIGKPAALFFEMALKDLNLSAQEVIMIGDDLESDIIGARNIGAGTCLVKTGKFRREDLQKSAVKPHIIMPSIAGIIKADLFV